MKVLIAGTRTFNKPFSGGKELYYFLRHDEVSEVVSGHSGNADLFGEDWAKARNIPVKIFEADWSKHGKAAGPIRNTEMAEYLEAGDKAVIFWDGESKGAKDMAKKAKQKIGENNILIVNYLEFAE